MVAMELSLGGDGALSRWRRSSIGGDPRIERTFVDPRFKTKEHQSRGVKPGNNTSKCLPFMVELAS
ncbi:hypothetical protein F2Q69_00008198 [Brassica cretica]|uniref:Uncharacterized protein n=1 Tax=Brassica cretica TaxID=69181 RepID=A0A8S9P9R3_BRACR|nr:hypothetical protein F2Q69_00008198 [Brassica cretica]